MASMPLSMLDPGQSAIVDQIVGQPNDVHRLEEMGLRRGAWVELVQPGSPCIVRLAGHKLCFRADDLTRVLVHSPSGR